MRDIFHKLLHCLIFAPFVFGTVLLAQTNKGITPISEDAGSKSENVRALIVGISDYQNVQSLNFADDDAINFYKYIVSSAGGRVDSNNIKLLLNKEATAMNIISGLYWLLEESKEGETVFIVFSGHGDIETKTVDQNGFLLANDAPKAVYMAGGTVDVRHLQSCINTLVKKNKSKVILIVDACRSGKLAGGLDGAKTTSAALQEQWDGVVKILSSEPGQLSQEDSKWGKGAGVFSFYLLNGLKGLADINNDHKVTLREINIYLSTTVPAETNETQTPVISGNQSTYLSAVDSLTLAALQKTKGIIANDNQLAYLKKDKGFDKNFVDLLEPEVKIIYEKFQYCISHGLLLSGKDTSGTAWEYYSKLKNEPGASNVFGSVKRTMLAALTNNAQIIINQWVAGKEIPDSIRFSKTEKEMEYACKVIDENHFLYNDIKGKYLWLKAINFDKESPKKLACLNEALELIPYAPFIYYSLGYYYNEIQDKQKSLDYHLKAEMYAPKWSYNLNSIGIAYSDLNQFDLSKKYYRKAMQVDSLYDNAYYNIASCYLDVNDPDSAMYYASLGHKLIPENDMLCRTLGRVYKFKNDYDNAEKYGKLALSLKKDADNFSFLAGIYNIKSKYSLALDYYQQALDYSYGNSKCEIYQNLGLIHNYLTDYAKSDECFEKAIKRDKENYSNYKWYGVANYRRNNFGKAIQLLNKAIDLNPNDNECYRYAGKIYLALIDYKKSLDNFRKAIKMQPYNDLNYYELATFYRFINKMDSAIYFGKKAISLNPNNEDNYSSVGWSYYIKMDYANAIPYLDSAIIINPYNASSYVELGRVYLSQREYKKSLFNIKKAIALDKTDNTNYYYLSDVYLKMNNYQEAIIAINQAIQIDSLYARNYQQLAKIYKVSGDYKNAELNYLKALDRNPRSLTITNDLAQLYYDMRDYNKSIGWFNKTLTIDQNNLYALTQLGNTYCLKGDYAKALKYHQKCDSIEPGDEVTNNNIAGINEYLKKYTDAEFYYKKAISLDPLNTKRYYFIAAFYRKTIIKNDSAIVYYTLAAKNPTDEFWQLLAKAYLSVYEKNYTAAEENISNAIALESMKMEGYYEMACLYAIQSKQDEAVKWLEKSFEHGLDDKLKITTDNDLIVLKNNSAFKKLMKKYF